MSPNSYSQSTHYYNIPHLH